MTGITGNKSTLAELLGEWKGIYYLEGEKLYQLFNLKIAPFQHICVTYFVDMVIFFLESICKL